MSTIRQLSFSAGEVSPSLYSHVDQATYATSLRTCRNMFVRRDGGAANRPGSVFVSEVKDSTKVVRLIPFILDPTHAYLLEFGHNYLRFYRDGAQITSTSVNITAATQASPCVLTSVAHGLGIGVEVTISGVVGMTQLNGRNFKTGAGTDADHLELKNLDGTNLDATSFSAYVSGGTAKLVYTVTTIYTSADVADLQFAQSPKTGDLYLTHRSYPVYVVTRTSDTSWAIAQLQPGPLAASPTVSPSASGTTNHYQFTGINGTTMEESSGSGIIATGATPITFTITAGTGNSYINIYKQSSVVGLYGLIATVATGFAYVDSGATPDVTNLYSSTRDPVSGTNLTPGTVTFYQQRAIFASSNAAPRTVWTTKSGLINNFNVKFPTQDDDAITFQLASKLGGTIMHLLDMGQALVLLTSTGEWAMQGDQSGTLTPTSINPKQYTSHGSSTLYPIKIDASALYVQARANIVRDLAFDIQIDGYKGNDLTIFSSHLFRGYTLADWAYQKTPDSLVMATRSDGKMLGLTYIREHQIVAWHRHDTDGIVENACAIPEGDQDALYVVVKRTINGATKRYIERFQTRDFTDIHDAVLTDCSASYDGRNTGSRTMTLSGGTTWGYTETLTCTASSGYFTGGDVGNAIHLTAADGSVIRFLITHYTSTTVVTGKANRTVPASLRSTSTTSWAKAVDMVTGLWHLEGKRVSILADGFVVASPNNAAYPVYIVAGGGLVLDRPYSVITVGLPYISDLETLDIDTDQGETLIDKKKLVGKVSLRTEKTRGLFVGPQPPTDDSVDPLEGLQELKIRNEEGYDEPVNLTTDVVEVVIGAQWNSNGRVFLRNVDPIPVTVNSIAPAGLIPFRR